MNTESSSNGNKAVHFLPIALFGVLVVLGGVLLYQYYHTRVENEQHRLEITLERFGETIEKDLLNHEQQVISLAEAAATLSNSDFADLCSTYIRLHEEVGMIYVKNAKLRLVQQIRQHTVKGLNVDFTDIADSSYYVSIAQPIYYTPLWRTDKEKYVAVERPIIIDGAFVGVVGLAVSFNRLLSVTIRSTSMSDYDAELVHPKTSDILAATSAISFRSPVQSSYTMKETGFTMQVDMVDTSFSFWDTTTIVMIAGGGTIALGILFWMFISLQNIRALRIAERTLRESEERFRILWDNSADGMRLTDRSGRIVMVNQAYSDLVKISPQKLTEDYRTGIIDDVRYGADSTYRHMFDAGAVKMPVAETIERPNGEKVSVEIANSYVHLPNGEKMMLSIYRDISMRKKMEEELQQVQRLDVLGRFAVDIGNNLNNILGIILNASEMLKPKVSGMQDAAEFLSMITTQTKRGGELVDDLLVFARTEHKEEREISIPKSLEHARKILDYSLSPTISVSLTLGDNNAVVKGDIHELHQAIVNLGLAAKERMPNGGALSIASYLMVSDDVRNIYLNALNTQYVVIMVNDNGTPMNVLQKQNIFEPYFSTQISQSNACLRLAVAYSIVRRHQGFTRIESDTEHGTTFSIYFPVVRHEDIPFDLEEPQPLEQGKGLVLIVDDEEAYRMLYEQEFLSLGYSVLIAKDGEEAVRAYEQYKEQISLVITDISMPNLNGEELFQRLVQMNSDVKVIFATGNIDARSRAEILNLGVKGIVEKPFAFAELMTLVQKVLHEWV